MTPPLFDNMVKAFVDAESWYSVNLFNSSVQKEQLLERISSILLYVKGEFGSRFYENMEDIVLGYNIFLKEFVSKTTAASSTSSKITMEDFYKGFWHQYHDTPEMNSFIEFFEFLQIKSYSEAICESVGSIMNMATGIFFHYLLFLSCIASLIPPTPPPLTQSILTVQRTPPNVCRPCTPDT